MNEYDFKTDTSKTFKKYISTKIRVLIGISTFLLGILSILQICFLTWGFHDYIWTDIGTTNFAWHIIMALCIFFSFAALVKIAIDKKPFSKTLSITVWAIGGVFLLASVIIPRLPDYQSSGFEILSKGSFVLIDGWILLPGLLLIILGSLIKAGWEIQKEIDEII